MENIMTIENFIENIYREFNDSARSNEYKDLYSEVKNEKLQIIFSTLQDILISEFKLMNTRLPTTNETSYFWAENSRSLLNAFDMIDRMKSTFKNTEYEFKVTNYYDSIISYCKEFLKQYKGSIIPENTEKIELYYTIPIFEVTNNKFIVKRNKSSFNLQLIGEGSYAKVFKYKDEDYDEFFVIKKLKNSATDREILRFKQEYILMKQNPHPNIVKVYKYFENNSYTMDYCGISLKKFIDKNNTKLLIPQRLDLISQLLDTMRFLHNKGLYHRDISYNNILIDSKFDKLFLKISDFGLTKDENNKITSEDSSIKGTYIDPCLDKFENYNVQNDIYALGMMINYIYFGKQNISTGTTKVHKVISKCIINDLSVRYKTVDEIIKDLFSNAATEDEFYSKIDIQKLKSEITEHLSKCSANDLPNICEGLGLKSGTTEESYKSKAGYVFRRIATLTKAETIDLVLKINDSMGCDIDLY